MNQLAPISYEDRAKARAMEVRRRLMGTPKRVNVIREVLAEVAEKARNEAAKVLSSEADEHVKAFRIWQECAFKQTTMADYAAQLCEQAGTTLDKIRTMRRNRALILCLDSIAFEMKMMFPHKPLAEIGRVLNREHSTITRSIERESMRRGIKEADVKAHSYPDLEDHLKSGKSLREIASIYEVGAATIGRRVQSLGISHLLQSKSKPVSMEFIETVREAYASGLTLTEISSRYGISARSVVNWKKTFDWPQRRKVGGG